MTAPRSAPSGQPGRGQPGAPAGERPSVVPRQQGPDYQEPDYTEQEIPGPGGLGQSSAGGRPDAGSRPGAGAGAQGRFAAGSRAPLGGQGWTVVLTVAVATLALGVLLLAWPHATLTIVAILLGAALLVSGLYRLFEGFTARGEGAATRVAYIVIGLVAALAGLYCLRHHSVTIFLLAFLLGAYWIIHGITDLAVAATSGPMPGRAFMVIAGVFSIAAGAVVLFWPSISLVLLLTILGAWLLFYGLVLAVLAFQLRRLSHIPA
jgi:uncharacterized membrane protein HdeD (DUF308 family)